MTHENATLTEREQGVRSAEEAGEASLVLELDPDDDNSNQSLIENQGTPQQQIRPALTNSLRAHSNRMRMARVRLEFEQSLLVVLTINVIYMYYIDHKLLVLLIRACQVIRLLHFPYASEASQRGTAVLLLVSNLPVLLIHKMLFSSSDVENNIGDMLFINFVGPEPKSLAKILSVDAIIMVLQAMLLQCKWDWEAMSFCLISALPVPISENLVPLTSPEQTPDTPDRPGENEDGTPTSPVAT